MKASHGNTKLNYAKLGHGKNFGTTRNPKKVEFDGVAINQVACGRLKKNFEINQYNLQ